MLTELKREAYEANLLLPRHGLINLTFGNASAIDRSRGIFAIKPSGVDYAALKPADMVLVDLAGKRVEGRLNPSSDTPTHRRLFNAFKKIGAVIHTHSTYATAFAQGHLGVQVWINQGMYQEDDLHGADAQEGQAPKKPKRTDKR